MNAEACEGQDEGTAVARPTDSPGNSAMLDGLAMAAIPQPTTSKAHGVAEADAPQQPSQAADAASAPAAVDMPEDDLELSPGLELETASSLGDAPGLHGTDIAPLPTEAVPNGQPSISPQQPITELQEQGQQQLGSQAAEQQQPTIALQEQGQQQRGSRAVGQTQPLQEEALDDSDIPDMDAIEQDAGAAQLPPPPPIQQQANLDVAGPAADNTAFQAVPDMQEAHRQQQLPLPMQQRQPVHDQQEHVQQAQEQMPSGTACGSISQHCGGSCSAVGQSAAGRQTEASSLKLGMQEACEHLLASPTLPQNEQEAAAQASHAVAHAQEDEQPQPQQAGTATGHSMPEETALDFEDVFADSHDVFASAHSQSSAQRSWYTAAAGGSFFASAHTALTANSSMCRSAVSTSTFMMSSSSQHQAEVSGAQAAAPVPEAGVAATDGAAMDKLQAAAAACEAQAGALLSSEAHSTQGSSDAPEVLHMPNSTAASAALDSSMQPSTVQPGDRFSTISRAGNDALQSMHEHPEASAGQASLLLAAAQPVGGYSVLVGPARGAINAAGSMSSTLHSQLQLMQERIASAAHATSAMRQSVPAAARQVPSSFMLRDSELVDLSLSTSVHPLMPVGALPQQLPPLPPAAQLAVRRAANALDSDEALPPLPRGRRGALSARGQQLHAGDECSEEGVLVERTPDMPVSIEQQEDAVFAGLLFCDGRDSHGRPVVVVNTDAIPNGVAAADAALQHLMRRMWPHVQGPYVLVLVACTGSRRPWLLPAMWCVRAYRGLARPFRKNVRYVVVVQPSMLVRTAITVVKPFVSKKAHAKLKQVNTLLDIDGETHGEVQVAHLGEAFLSALQSMQQERLRQEEHDQQQQQQQQQQEAQRQRQHHHQAPAVLQPLAQVLHWPKWSW